MKRRSLIKAGLTSGSLVAVGVTGWSLLKSPADNSFTSLRSVVEFIQATPETTVIESSGVWSPFQIIAHLRQSMVYSMVGFPEEKSSLFQNTLGTLAFHIFNAKGATTHGLSTPIPGAEHLPVQGNTFQELQRLKSAIEQFLNFKHLKPHFAYGELSPGQYEQAQLFHINEHLTELSFRAEL